MWNHALIFSLQLGEFYVQLCHRHQSHDVNVSIALCFLLQSVPSLTLALARVGLLCVNTVLPFLEFHINVVIHDVVFVSGYYTYINTFWDSSKLLCMSLIHFLLFLSSILIVCLHYNLYIQSALHGLLFPAFGCN